MAIRRACRHPTGGKNVSACLSEPTKLHKTSGGCATAKGAHVGVFCLAVQCIVGAERRFDDKDWVGGGDGKECVVTHERPHRTAQKCGSVCEHSRDTHWYSLFGGSMCVGTLWCLDNEGWIGRGRRQRTCRRL